METKRTQTKVAMNYGALYGLAAIAVSLIFYFLNTDFQSKWPQYTSWLIQIIFIALGIKSYRDEDLGGFIGYGKSVGTGILISIFGGILIAIYTVVFFQYIAPEMVQKILDAAQQKMGEQGTPEEQIEIAMHWTAKMMTPGWLFAFALFGSSIMGLIWSLIISIFMKRDSNPFQPNLG
jgi:hypothetical protein